MLEFILARYNYWIVITLMMTGLYIVFSRGNLVKTLIGLNLFQTSVFIFYITVGKVAGGTAPILIGGHAEDGGDHGGDHGESGHLAPAPGHVGEASAIGHGSGSAEGASSHLEETHTDAASIGTGALEGPLSGHGAGGGSLSGEIGMDVVYSNPLPHVLILTAIVVGVATTAVGLSLAVRIREAYGTVEEDQLELLDNADDVAEART
jgi:multicomponent Na+:H+ antiporter subunit C